MEVVKTPTSIMIYFDDSLSVEVKQITCAYVIIKIIQFSQNREDMKDKSGVSVLCNTN